MNMLNELRTAAGMSVVDMDEEDELKDGVEDTESRELQKYLLEFDSVKDGIRQIEEHVEEMRTLVAEDRVLNIDPNGRRQRITQELNRRMAAVAAQAGLVKKALGGINARNQQHAVKHPHAASGQIRVNLYQTHLRHLHHALNEFNQTSNEYKQQARDRTVRELRVVDDTLTDEQIERIVEPGQQQDVIKQALASERLRGVVQDIERRHEKVLEIEQAVNEVFELFCDLATLVELQQESLDVIEHRVRTSKNYLGKAEMELRDAEKYQNKARKRMWCLVIVIVVILVVVVAIVFGSGVV